MNSHNSLQAFQAIALPSTVASYRMQQGHQGSSVWGPLLVVQLSSLISLHVHSWPLLTMSGLAAIQSCPPPFSTSLQLLYSL